MLFLQAHLVVERFDAVLSNRLTISTSHLVFFLIANIRLAPMVL